MRYKTRGHHKSSDLLSVLLSHFSPFMNLARIKCLSQLVCAMCKVQTVNFSKLASAFDNRTPKDSSMRRIQRFMAQTVLNLDIVAKVVMKLLPETRTQTPFLRSCIGVSLKYVWCARPHVLLGWWRISVHTRM